MMTTPAPQGGAGSDEPTGLGLWQDRPVGYLDRGIVRTSFSNAEPNQLCSRRVLSESSSRIQSTSCCFEIASTEIAVAGVVLDGAEAVAGANGDRNTGGSGGLPPTRPAACRRSDPPDHRQRVCGGGGCSGAGRYRTLHLWAAMVRTATNHRLKRSTSISGVSS